MEKRDEQTYAIIGAAIDVHKELGHGFLEAAYQEALEVEFKLREIPHRREESVPIYFKGKRLETVYRADFICFDSIIVELKAIAVMSGVEEAQVIHYLKATGLNKALLINFGKPSLEYRRLVLTQKGNKKFSADYAD